MKLIILIFSFLFSAQLVGQIKITGEVRSTRDSLPIDGAYILNSNDRLLDVSESSGTFSFLYYPNEVIEFSHVGFVPRLLKANEITSHLIIYLEPLSINVGVAEVVPEPLPEVVYQDDSVHVSDYIFTDDGILILTFATQKMFKTQEEQNKTLLKDCSVVLLDNSLRILAESKQTKSGVRLHEYDGSFFLETRSGLMFIEINAAKTHIGLIEVDKGILSVIETKPLLLDGYSVVSNFDSSFPSFGYYLTTDDSDYTKEICRVEDEELMHVFRAQYRNLLPRGKLEAYRMELSSGIDKEIISGYMTGFHQSIYFKPPYAPLFKTSKGLHVFNHLDNHLHTYSLAGEKLGKSEINYHLKPRVSGWNNLIVQDIVSEEIYITFSKNGITSLRNFNFKENKLLDSFELLHKYPENIQVKDGFIYYVYRPFSSSQKKYLYKQAMY